MQLDCHYLKGALSLHRAVGHSRVGLFLCPCSLILCLVHSKHLLNSLNGCRGLLCTGTMPETGVEQSQAMWGGSEACMVDLRALLGT